MNAFYKYMFIYEQKLPKKSPKNKFLLWKASILYKKKAFNSEKIVILAHREYEL